MFDMRRRRKHFQGKASYIAFVLPVDLTALWPMNESAGVVAEEIIANMDGAYSGAALAQATFPLVGLPCPDFDGVNDFLNIYSAAFASAFRLTKGFISVWVQNDNPSEITVTRQIFYIFRDVNNYITAFKNGSANSYSFRFVAGTTNKTVTVTIADTNPFHLLIEWADAANGSYLRVWKNNAQIVNETTGIGTVTGSGLNSANVVIGAINTSGANSWNGKISVFGYKALAASTVDDRKRLSGGQ